MWRKPKVLVVFNLFRVLHGRNGDTLKLSSGETESFMFHSHPVLPCVDLWMFLCQKKSYHISKGFHITKLIPNRMGPEEVIRERRE